jgi:hypothetical protein
MSCTCGHDTADARHAYTVRKYVYAAVTPLGSIVIARAADPIHAFWNKPSGLPTAPTPDPSLRLRLRSAKETKQR